MLERSSPFRRSAACIIATSGSPPEHLPFWVPGCTARHRLLAVCHAQIRLQSRQMTSTWAVEARTIKLTVNARGPYTISIHGPFWPEPRSDEVFGNDRHRQRWPLTIRQARVNLPADFMQAARLRRPRPMNTLLRFAGLHRAGE